MDMTRLSESCNVYSSVNEPLINYLDVRFLKLKPEDTGCREEGWGLQQGPVLHWWHYDQAWICLLGGFRQSPSLYLLCKAGF